MNDSDEGRQPVTASGLCDTCQYRRDVPNDRGGRFIQCDLARRDPAYRRYPVLPVIVCAGHVRADVG